MKNDKIRDLKCTTDVVKADSTTHTIVTVHVRMETLRHIAESPEQTRPRVLSLCLAQQQAHMTTSSAQPRPQMTQFGPATSQENTLLARAQQPSVIMDSP